MTETAERCRCGETGPLYESTDGRVCMDCYLAAVEAGNGWTVVKPEKSKIEPSSSSGLPPTSEVAPPSSISSEPVVDIGVDVDVVPVAVSTEKDKKSAHRTPKTGSERFEVLYKDAQRFGTRPLDLDLPADLAPAQVVVAEDFAVVAAVYVTLDGEAAVRADGVPYACRWRTDVLGLSPITVSRALRALVARGVLEDRGETRLSRSS